MNFRTSVGVATLFFSLLCAPSWAKEPEKAKWDVSNPPGPREKVSLDLRTGTWLSLDVSPDGKTIVFDLLGDLYLLDMAGGLARSLSSGLEWDMHPTFSPDGKKIAFTSDRGGGDNVWVMTVAGGESSAKALSKESFRLLSQPEWAPTGDHIVARKHFTGTRSLGAGEIWAFHLDGGSGVQLTKRKNDQLDLGEPAFSPDGKYLYYSLDATGGDRFQYNKDPNKGIYAIERLNRQTGETERVLSGPGGAIAPSPSPDGKYLAFVRRIRGKTVLMLQDLEDGSERQLFDDLDRDMQETWAIHGVYPRFSWTPDSQSLVFWAKGQIWRLPLADPAQVKTVAFHIKEEREVGEAVRFAVEVAPKEFPVKAIREPQQSPTGAKTVFSALGKVWLKSGKAAPQRLTELEGQEYDARFVNENDVLFAHWHDETLGSIRLWKGATSEVLVKDGRFAHPVLSPDGRYLIFGKRSKNSLFDSRYTAQPGLYMKDLVSGEVRKLDARGRTPHFGKDPQVLYFNTGDDPVVLVRLELNTGRRQELFSGKTVVNFFLSPDESTLAILDGFSLYVTPFVPTGQTLDLTGDSKVLPLQKVSTDLGAYFPSWSPSNVLSWNVGPTLWSYSPKSKQKSTTDLGWMQNAASPGPASKVALVGGKLVTMKGEEVIEDGVVVLQDDRIVAIGPAASTPVPAGAFTIDCSGKTVLPGLIDVHWHGSFSDQQVFPQVNYVGLSSLSFGLTTLHDPSNDTASVFTAKEMQRAGHLLAPRVFSTGTILYGAKAPSYFAQVDSLEDALGHLKRLKAWGAISVKSYNQPRRDQRQQILEAARKTEMMVVPEGGSLYQHNMSMVLDGHTGVEHALPVSHIYDDVVSLWSQTEVGYTPTLGVAYGGIWGENYWYLETDVWEDERLNRFVPQEVIDPDARRRFHAPDEEFNHLNSAAAAKKMADAGVRVNLGAHGQREGLAVHWELWMLEQGGMTPHQALRCGTINGAKYLGMDKDIGSLEVGKLADIIVIDGDPLQDIRRSKFVDYTILGGKVYRADTMKRIGPGEGPEPILWWRAK